MSVFNSEKIIQVKSPHNKLKIYYSGFDIYDYGHDFQYDELVEQIQRVIVDFAYGFHEGILNTNYNIQFCLQGLL